MINEVLNRIREMRIMKGISCEQFANELNLSPGAYRKIEKNRTRLTLERLFQISDALEIGIEDLLKMRAVKTDAAINGTELPNIQALYAENIKVTKKLIEQYEARLKEKDRIIRLFEKRREEMD